MQKQYRADVVPLVGSPQDERFAEGFRMNDFAEFRHFKYLLEVLLQEGFRPAAENLHTTPPNLCRQAQEFQEDAIRLCLHFPRQSRGHPIHRRHDQTQPAPQRRCFQDLRIGVSQTPSIAQGMGMG